MIKRFLCLFLFWTCSHLPLAAEFRTFTNDFGDSVEAELVGLKDSETIVTLKLRSGNQIDARVTAFSQADQKHIRKWGLAIQAEKQLLKEDSRITISAKMNRKSKSNQYDNWYSISDETKSFFPEVIIENDELDAFKGNTVRIVVIAKDKQDDGQKLVVSATTMKDISFPDRGEAVLESDPFRLRLYEYDSSYSNFDYGYGYEYEGFVVVIQNADGKVTHTRASKSKYLSNMDVIFKCKAGELYDDAINRKLNARPNSYFVQ
jgi:hypothetical protein